tara:strand:+ start:120 stop:1007 length:888 start_codon:yes stop_codon:yes gene_type:complete
MKNILIIFISLLLSTAANADDKAKVLNKVSGKIGQTIASIIPGEGITETSLELRDDSDDSNFEFSILGVRDILSKENSNLFTQVSLHTQDINNDQRIVGNFGLGYRILTLNQSMMFGTNIFYDQDYTEGHNRLGFGLEGKAAMLDFSYNEYFKSTNQKIVNGIKEQVLSGYEYNISSQIPYMPWSKINYQEYEWDNEKAKNNLEGSIYSIEMALTQSLDFNLEKDVSSVTGVDDKHNYELVYVYPPRENKPTLLDGLVSNLAFEKKNMQNKLKEKVRRNNNLVVEIQGSVVFTSK